MHSKKTAVVRTELVAEERNVLELNERERELLFVDLGVVEDREDVDAALQEELE